MTSFIYYLNEIKSEYLACIVFFFNQQLASDI